MTPIQECSSFIERVCNRLGCADLIRPLQEGLAAVCESITEPTMWLRKAYGKSAVDCPDTPKFNEAWHRYEYDGSSIAIDAMLENPSLVRKIVDGWEADGIHPDACRKFADEEFCLEEADAKELAEMEPDRVAKTISRSTEFCESDQNILSFNHTVVNGWLVHNSDNAWDIWRDGFMYGNDIGQLAYSGAGSTRGKEYGDYLFAFPIDDAPSPSMRDGLKYGEASIVFIGTGNEFYHYGDEENQVIFDRREPKGCFIVVEQEYGNDDGYGNYWCVIGDNEYHPLFHSEEYRECMKWIMRNGNRFLRSMRMWNNVLPGRQVENERVWK